MPSLEMPTVLHQWKVIEDLELMLPKHGIAILCVCVCVSTGFRQASSRAPAGLAGLQQASGTPPAGLWQASDRLPAGFRQASGRLPAGFRQASREPARAFQGMPGPSRAAARRTRKAPHGLILIPQAAVAPRGLWGPTGSISGPLGPLGAPWPRAPAALWECAKRSLHLFH